MGGAEKSIRVQLCLISCREIVKGSHLRPLEQKDTRGSGGFRQPWNTAAREGNTKDTGRGGGEGGSGGLGEGGSVLNQQSFVREWRRQTSQPQDQYRCAFIGRPRRIFKLKAAASLVAMLRAPPLVSDFC